MKEIWATNEGTELELFDSEETAREAYKIWCKLYNEQFDEDTFKMCYVPLEKCITIWTKKTLKDYIPS